MSDQPAVDPVTAETPPTETPPAQPSDATPATPQPATPPAGYIEQARYNGLVKKVEELTLSLRETEGQLAAKTSEYEQLNEQLSIKDTEKTVAVGERDKALQTALTENQAKDTELAELRALKLKLEVAKELQRPDLVAILEQLPNLEDKEALTVVAKDFLGWGDQLVSEREKQLSAGVTDPISSVTAAPAKPTTSEGWENYINSLPIGTPERDDAFNEFGDWAESQQTQP
jgi:vacuolar-type H+-ATPase subunit I/STV1